MDDVDITVEDTYFPVVKLKHPIEWADQEITELRIRRRPTAEHMQKTDKAKGDVGRLLILIRELCDVPMGVVKRLDMADVIDFGEELDDFLGKSPPTGGTS